MDDIQLYTQYLLNSCMPVCILYTYSCIGGCDWCFDGIFHPQLSINFNYLPSVLLVDYAQEQEMEIEALEAILMDEFKGLWHICL